MAVEKFREGDYVAAPRVAARLLAALDRPIRLSSPQTLAQPNSPSKGQRRNPSSL
jgi:hypothetical protein